MHISHNSRHQGQESRHADTICHSQFQPLQIPTPPKGPHCGIHKKDCNEGEVLQICTMEELESSIPETGYQNGKDRER